MLPSTVSDGETERPWATHRCCSKSRSCTDRLPSTWAVALLDFRRALLDHLCRVSAERLVQGQLSERSADLVMAALWQQRSSSAASRLHRVRECRAVQAGHRTYGSRRRAIGS